MKTDRKDLDEWAAKYLEDWKKAAEQGIPGAKEDLSLYYKRRLRS